MCGIFGIIGEKEVAPLLLEGLKRLEYRGYDSAGIATLSNGHIDCRRAEGKLSNLTQKISETGTGKKSGMGNKSGPEVKQVRKDIN